MKRLIRILLTSLVILTYSQQVLLSQITPQKKSKTYFTWVKSMDNSYSKVGYLKEIKDSMICVHFKARKEKKYIEVADIKYLQFRKKGKEINGFLLGGLTGFAIGAMIGYSSGDDKNAGGGFFNSGFGLYAQDKAIISGVVCTLPGAIMGGIIGSIRVKIPIYGNQNNYNNQKAKLEKYKYKY